MHSEMRILVATSGLKESTSGLIVGISTAATRDAQQSTSATESARKCPLTWAPCIASSRKQTNTSQSTPEAELVACRDTIYKEGIPLLDLLDSLFGKKHNLYFLEDNTAAIQVIEKGFSVAMRHLDRTQGLSLSALHDTFCESPQGDHISLKYCDTRFMRADIFTKRFAAGPDWKKALRAIGMHFELPSPELLFPDPGQNKAAGAKAQAENSEAEPQGSAAVAKTTGEFGAAGRERVWSKGTATEAVPQGAATE